MKTVSLPTRDATGELSPLVLEAINAGATASLDPTDVHNTLLMTFDKDAAAKTFKAAVNKIIKTADEAEEATLQLAEYAADPVEPEADKPVSDPAK